MYNRMLGYCFSMFGGEGFTPAGNAVVATSEALIFAGSLARSSQRDGVYVLYQGVPDNPGRVEGIVRLSPEKRPSTGYALTGDPSKWIVTVTAVWDPAQAGSNKAWTVTVRRESAEPFEVSGSGSFAASAYNRAVKARKSQK